MYLHKGITNIYFSHFNFSHVDTKFFDHLRAGFFKFLSTIIDLCFQINRSSSKYRLEQGARSLVKTSILHVTRVTTPQLSGLV